MAVILSLIPTNPKKVTCTAKKETIYLSTNGIHLDIILPQQQVSVALMKALAIPATVPYIAFGWGDKDFYLHTPTWQDLTFKTFIKAMFFKSESVMHVTKYNGQRTSWVAVAVCKQQIDKINQYIAASFQTTSTGEVLEIKDAGYTRIDTFYEAKGSYTCFNTCNNWVNGLLKQANIRTAIWSPSDHGILYQVRKEN